MSIKSAVVADASIKQQVSWAAIWPTISSQFLCLQLYGNERWQKASAFLPIASAHRWQHSRAVTPLQWQSGTQGEMGTGAHGGCCGEADSHSWAELRAAKHGFVLRCLFLNKNFLCIFFCPLKLLEPKLFFHVWFRMEMLFFLFFFLSKELVEFFFFSIIQRPLFFFPLCLLFTLDRCLIFQ